MRVPFVNFRIQYEYLRKDLESRLSDVFEKMQFVRGPEVALFQNEFAKLLGAGACVTTGNGTDALLLSLKALTVSTGDEVITPAFSWISSSETVTACNAVPVFADVNPETFTIDPDQIIQKISPRTKGIIAVHLYGQAARVRDIQALCKQHNLFLIEDCAQSHLTADGDQYAGTFGNAGCFSFYPTKNLGAYGDAGCVVTSDRTLAEKIRRLANHGALLKDDHELEGLNSRMDTIQAAVLLAKLPHLPTWTRSRQRLARLYSELLAPIDKVIPPVVRPNTQHTFHLYVIRAERRNELQAYLYSRGVETIIHYPSALPNLPAYGYLHHKPNDFPVSSMLAKQVLSLPLYPEMTEDQVTYVCEIIASFYKK